MKTVLKLIILIFMQHSFGQAPAIEWQKTIGGSDDDFCTQTVQTKDGGYISIGQTSSDVSFDKTDGHLLIDYWIIKTNENGDILWQKNYGGYGGDRARVVLEIEDGYLISGNSDSEFGGMNSCGPIGPFFGGNEPDYTWLLKLDLQGNILWQKAKYFTTFDILKTNDQGFILAGSMVSNQLNPTPYNYHLSKLNHLGETVWERTLGGDDNDYYGGIIKANDDGYIIGGSSKSPISGDKTEDRLGLPDNWGYYSGDIWILKLDNNGNIIWQNTIGGSGGDG